MTEHQHVDAAEVDMILGSMAGPISAAGGFCAGSDEVVEHQRLSAAAYTFSAALPAMSAVTASETIMMLQTQPEIIRSLRENIAAMWQQLDPKSDWMTCTSAPESPIMLMVFKPDVISNRRLSLEDQTVLLQEVADEVSGDKVLIVDLANPVQCLNQSILITRVKVLSPAASGVKVDIYSHRPALKICMTNGLSRKEVEKAGTTIRHAITKIMTKKR